MFSTLYKVNYFFMGLPIILALTALEDEDNLIGALLSTILTGAYQVIIGIILFSKQPENKHIQIYLGTVLVYFISAYYFIDVEEIFYLWIIVPTILAFYFSFILFKEAQKEEIKKREKIEMDSDTENLESSL